MEPEKKNEKKQSPEDENLANFQNFLQAQNAKSKLDLGRIMDDTSVGSLLNPNNNPARKTAAIATAPGVNLDDKIRHDAQPNKQKESDSIIDLSSKGSTTKSIFNQIDSNEQKLSHIENLLETFMKNLDTNDDTNQDRSRKPASGSHKEPPPPAEGPSL